MIPMLILVEKCIWLTEWPASMREGMWLHLSEEMHFMRVWGKTSHGTLCIYINFNIDHVTLLIVCLNQQNHVTYMLKNASHTTKTCVCYHGQQNRSNETTPNKL